LKFADGSNAIELYIKYWGNGMELNANHTATNRDGYVPILQSLEVLDNIESNVLEDW